MGGAVAVDVPGFYAINGTGSKAFAFEIPEVSDGATVDGTLVIAAKSGKICSGGILVTGYSGEAFEDTDGTYKTAWENSLDADKTEYNWDFDFFIDAA